MPDLNVPKAAPVVTATLEQAYDLNLKINILPTREIPNVVRIRCQPRQGARRQDKDALELPEPLREILVRATPAVMAWLARDASNQEAFLLDPVAALEKAGVTLQRSQQKELLRLRDAANSMDAVRPGLQLRSVRVSSSRGPVKVGDTKTGVYTTKPSKQDCACKPGKE